MIRILTKNGVDNTNVDGARDHNFNAGRRSGIVQGALNQGNFFASNNNTIALDTCELRLCGHRIVLDKAEYRTFTNKPSVPVRYSFVARVVVDSDDNVSFEFVSQEATTQLVQDNLDITGSGTYELEIGKFTQLTDGNITDVVRTADLITGGADNDSDYIRIGTVTTNKISPELDADVDIENTINPTDNKPQTNFTFNLPTAVGTVVSVNGEEKTAINTDLTPTANSENLITSGGVHDYPAIVFAESERQKSKNLFDYTKIKSLTNGITVIDGIFNINTKFYYPSINYDINLNQGETYTFSLNIDSYSNSDGSGVNSEIVLYRADGSVDAVKGVGGVNSTGRYSMTFTPVFDVVSVEIRPIRKDNDTSTLTGIVSNLMICTGEDRDYQPYNGEIVHDGDTAVKFAEKEYQKSKNLFNYEDIMPKPGLTADNNGTFYIDTTGYYIIQQLNIPFELNKTYTMSGNVVSITGGDRPTFEFAVKYKDGEWVSYASNVITGAGIVSASFTPTKEVDLFELRFVRQNTAGQELQASINNLQLEEGSTATNYQPYNGKIVHKKDIEPILIYDIDTKNTIEGTAYTNGVKFGANTIIIVAGYSKIKIYTRVYNTYNITEVVIDKTGWTGNSFMVFGEASAIKNVGILIYHEGTNITPAECYNFSDNAGLNNNDNAYVYRIEGIK